MKNVLKHSSGEQNKYARQRDFFLKCHFNALLLEIYSASLVSIIYLIDVVFL